MLRESLSLCYSLIKEYSDGLYLCCTSNCLLYQYPINKVLLFCWAHISTFKSFNYKLHIMMCRDQVIRVNVKSEEQIHLLQALETAQEWEVCTRKHTRTALVNSTEIDVRVFSAACAKWFLINFLAAQKANQVQLGRRLTQKVRCSSLALQSFWTSPFNALNSHTLTLPLFSY